MRINELAVRLNAAVVYDRDENLVALMERYYGDDGAECLRFAPDPCDYLPVEEWEPMSVETARGMLS